MGIRDATCKVCEVDWYLSIRGVEYLEAGLTVKCLDPECNGTLVLSDKREVGEEC